MNDNDDDEIRAYVLFSLAALIVLLLVVYAIGGFNLIVGREFSKFGEETRRQVQEESRAYQEGMAQNLDKLCLEWERTGNAAVAQSIRHRAAGYNGELPEYIQQCVNLARKGS